MVARPRGYVKGINPAAPKRRKRQVHGFSIVLGIRCLRRQEMFMISIVPMSSLV